VSPQQQSRRRKSEDDDQLYANALYDIAERWSSAVNVRSTDEYLNRNSRKRNNSGNENLKKLRDSCALVHG